jgi:hypothetical protein
MLLHDEDDLNNEEGERRDLKLDSTNHGEGRVDVIGLSIA